MAHTYTSRIPTDQLVGALIAIDQEHHQIHEGHSFSAMYTRTTAATSGHRSAIYFKTPAAVSGLVHAVFSFAVSAAATYSICEAPTIAANVGTHTSVPVNRYRDSTTVSTIKNNATTPAANKYTTLDETQIAADGTFATGTVIRTAPVGTGVGAQAAGGVERGTQEYILKADTAYIILLANTTATATVHHILVDWYEETPHY